ncbi:MAG: permease prefix domain 1-containing protein [Trueperella sp.]|nr:permease prefix domain 1-containing protein [Trueperella sp.]
MEAIALYLSNMFQSFPDTPEVRRARSELAQMMEDKYQQLRAEGVTENAAVGTVITEFGNLDELTEVLGVSAANLSQGAQPVAAAVGGEQPTAGIETLVLKDAEVCEFEKRHDISAKRIGAAIGIFVASAAPLLFIISFLSGDLPSQIGVVILLMLVALGLYLLIPAAINIDQYDKWKGKYLEMPLSTRDRLLQARESERPQTARQVAIGIVLILLGIAVVVIMSAFDTPDFEYSVLGAGIMLIFIGSGAGLLASVGINNEKYERIFGEGEYTPKTPREMKFDQLFGAFAGVYWIAATAGYLIWSFITADWGITWVLWPIAGLAFAAIAVIADAVKKSALPALK